MLKLAVAFAALVAGVEGAFSEAVRNVEENLGEDRVIHLPFEFMTREAANILADVDDFGNNVSGADMRVSFQTVAALESAGIEHFDVTDEFVGELKANFERGESFVCDDLDTNEGATACGAEEFETADLELESTPDPSFYNRYHKLRSLYLRIDQIAFRSNGIAEVGSMGQSFEGRDQKVIFIRRGQMNQRPTVFYMCGIHAREWLPIHFCVYMAERLVNEGRGHELLDKVNFIIVPVFNPDGYQYSQDSDNLWRKSRMPTSKPRCVGTDLNRNYDIQHCQEGASRNPCSQTYCGINPFDNRETDNQRNFMQSLRQQGVNFLAAVDVHAKGLMWMTPYGYTRALPPRNDYDKMIYCARKGADAFKSKYGNKMKVGTIANTIYKVSGGSKDWFYDRMNIKYSWGLEVRGSSFQPHEKNIMPSNKENWVGMKAAVECAYEIEFQNGNFPGGQSNDDEVECVDRFPSGLKFNDGREVSCDELEQEFCNAYAVVRERCPRKCGTCSFNSCQDKNPSGLTFSSGREVPCYEAQRFCSAYESVRNACPRTCGQCQEENVAGKFAEELLLVEIIDLNAAAEGVPTAIYGAMFVAAMGFVGAVSALFTLYKRMPKNEQQTVPRVQL